MRPRGVERLPARPEGSTRGRAAVRDVGRSRLRFTQAGRTEERARLAHVSAVVLRRSDGRNVDSPRFLRRAEKKLRRCQRELSRNAS
jgi:acyl-CoA thioesterase FadM